MEHSPKESIEKCHLEQPQTMQFFQKHDNNRDLAFNCVKGELLLK